MKSIKEVLESYKEAKESSVSTFNKAVIIEKPKLTVVDHKEAPCFQQIGDLVINTSFLDSNYGRCSPIKFAKNYCIEHAMKGSLTALIYLTKVLAMSGSGYKADIKACLDQIALDAPSKVNKLYMECYPSASENPYANLQVDLTTVISRPC